MPSTSNDTAWLVTCEGRLKSRSRATERRPDPIYGGSGQHAAIALAETKANVIWQLTEQVTENGICLSQRMFKVIFMEC